MLVTGKGGVGKTTVCASLALQLAAKNKRVLVAMCNAKERLSAMFGCDLIGKDVMQAAPNVWAVNMAPEPALAEYGAMVLKSKTLSKLVFDNKYIDLIIREGKRFYGEGEKQLCLPLTTSILCRIVNEIQEDYDGFNLKASLCVAFARFLRSREFMWDSPVNCLPHSSIAFNSDNSIILTLSSSKTDPFQRGVAIPLVPSPNSPICPVNALR